MSMQIITINIPHSYFAAMKSFEKLGLYNSRSQIIREALKEFLDKEHDFTQDLISEQFEKIKSVQC
jgi:Arc/MetJ-type ribon-helix-helix transcriptional regulator